MRISRAEMADIPMMTEIEKQSFSDPWTAEGFAAEFDNAFGIFLAAHDDDGSIAGYIVGDCDGFSAYISNVAVSSAFRRKGVGTQLLDALRAELPETAENISLEVRESNAAAVGMYEKYGFKAAGIRKNFYSSPAENAVVMIFDIERGK